MRRLAPATPYLEGSNSQVYIFIKLGNWNSRIPNAQCPKVHCAREAPIYFTVCILGFQLSILRNIDK